MNTIPVKILIYFFLMVPTIFVCLGRNEVTAKSLCDASDFYAVLMHSLPDHVGGRSGLLNIQFFPRT